MPLLRRSSAVVAVSHAIAEVPELKNSVTETLARSGAEEGLAQWPLVRLEAAHV